MSIETVKRLAELAGDDISHTLQSDLDFLERFAALVAHESGEVMRERCVGQAMEIANCEDNATHYRWSAEHCAERTRALPGVTLEDIS